MDGLQPTLHSFAEEISTRERGPETHSTVLDLWTKSVVFTAKEAREKVFIFFPSL